ncbi:Fc.00g105730.m01.CDS01 [Cosmosporella sp. VM-42]
MRFSLSTVVLPAALVAAQVPDQPVNFYAQLYKESDNCSGGATAAYLGSRGNCVNIPISGNGSAIIKVGEAATYYLAGWTEADCKGTVVLVESNPGVCTSLGGTNVASWSDDLSPFEK